MWPGNRSDCVSDCRYSGAGSTIEPEDTRTIRFRTPLNLVENLKANTMDSDSVLNIKYDYYISIIFL